MTYGIYVGTSYEFITDTHVDLRCWGGGGGEGVIMIAGSGGLAMGGGGLNILKVGGEGGLARGGVGLCIGRSVGGGRLAMDGGLGDL